MRGDATATRRGQIPSFSLGESILPGRHSPRTFCSKTSTNHARRIKLLVRKPRHERCNPHTATSTTPNLSTDLLSMDRFQYVLCAVGIGRRFTTAKSKLTWYVPRWSYTGQLWSQLSQILNPASLIRIAFGTATLSAAIIVGLKCVFPQMVLPNLLPLVFALPAIVLMLVAQLGILTLIPPTATIRSDKILVHHGQSATIIAANTVKATYLTFHGDDRIRLRICYTKKSTTKSRVIGVPSTVDLDLLSEMLPIAPVVRDARDRSFTQ